MKCQFNQKKKEKIHNLLITNLLKSLKVELAAQV